MSASPVHAPRFDRLHLNDLVPAGPEVVRPRADLEGLRVAGVTADVVDLTAAMVHGCAVDDVRTALADLRRTRLSDSRLSTLDSPVLRAAECTWRGVTIDASRLGAVEATGSRWHSVQVIDSRIGYLSMRGSVAVDLALRDCVIDELDLTDASLTRASFAGCRIGRLEVQHATLVHTDLRQADISTISGLSSLRGATISGEQLLMLAPLLAEALGLNVDG